eukprot:CAMPEP_0117438042 /NCGR_PEP_ID=MMETSP0759-20121206/1845_1 /TAXON_ID=63605 /ORGANISM="Percolomonas cosmopolitus, Strain WS" /LENGTH=413 /DNA_ID=CAMNT_0005229713 /DNA_START=245 /DNA_END=1489 /DNA_ORIENTATION=-
MYNEFERIGMEGFELRGKGREPATEERRNASTRKRLENPVESNHGTQTTMDSANTKRPNNMWYLHSLLNDSTEKHIYFPHIHPEFYISLKVDQIIKFPFLERLLRKHLLNTRESRFIPQFTWMLCMMDDQIHGFLCALSTQDYHSLAAQAGMYLSYNYRDFLLNSSLQNPRHHIFRRFIKNFILKEDRSSSSYNPHLFDPMEYYDPIVDFLGITLIQWHMMHHIHCLHTVFYSITDKYPIPSEFTDSLSQPLFWMHSSLAPLYKVSYIFLRSVNRPHGTPADVIPFFIYLLNQRCHHSIDYIREQLQLALKMYHSQLINYDNNSMMPYLLEFLLDIVCNFQGTCHEADEHVDALLAASTAQNARQTLHPRTHPFLRASSAFVCEESQGMDAEEKHASKDLSSTEGNGNEVHSK